MIPIKFVQSIEISLREEIVAITDSQNHTNLKVVRLLSHYDEFWLHSDESIAPYYIIITS